MVSLLFHLEPLNCAKQGYNDWTWNPKPAAALQRQAARLPPASLTRTPDWDRCKHMMCYAWDYPALLQLSVFMQREQILRELELLYFYLFQQILYTVSDYPTIVSGLLFSSNLHKRIPISDQTSLNTSWWYDDDVPSKILTYGKPCIQFCWRHDCTGSRRPGDVTQDMQSDVVYTFQMLFNLQHLPMTPDTSCLQLESFAHVPVQSVGPLLSLRAPDRAPGLTTNLRLMRRYNIVFLSSSSVMMQREQILREIELLYLISFNRYYIQWLSYYSIWIVIFPQTCTNWSPSLLKPAWIPLYDLFSCPKHDLTIG